MPRTTEQDSATRRQGPAKALTPTTTRTGADGFERTALVITGAGESQSGSFDLVDDEGVLLARVNVFMYRGHAGKAARRVIIDTIDVDGTFAEHRAVTFLKGARKSTPTGTLVSADFSNESPPALEATPPPLNATRVRARNVNLGDQLHVGPDGYEVVSIAVLSDPDRIMMRARRRSDGDEISVTYADDERVPVLR